MKRLLPVLLCVFLLLGLFSGCAGGKIVTSGYVTLYLPNDWSFRSATDGNGLSDEFFYIVMEDSKGNKVMYAMRSYSGEETAAELLETAFENADYELVAWLDNMTVSDIEFTAAEYEYEGETGVTAYAVKDNRRLSVSVTDPDNKDIIKILESMKINLYHYEAEFSIT